jgi:type IV pilus assembly protein PilN
LNLPIFHGNQDLLRQRRLVRGLPAEPKPLPSASRLLVQGAMLGSICIGIVIGFWLLASLRLSQVRAELRALQSIPRVLNELEKQVPAEKKKLDAIQSANDGLVKGLVAVSSGSALLTQLFMVTPIGVQLTDVSVKDSEKSVSLKGLAVDPMAFRRVNALSLLLARSSLFEPTSVNVVKLTRDEAKASAQKAGEQASLPPIAWELTVKLATIRPVVLLELLKQLGADGMAQRLRMLERAGVLP